MYLNFENAFWGPVSARPKFEAHFDAERISYQTIPHRRLDKIFQLTAELSGKRTLTDYLFRESAQLGERLSDIGGVAGVAGLGFPFYSVDRDGEPVAVPEIQDFIARVRDILKEDAKANPEGWEVPECPHSLSAPCDDCRATRLTPREVIKTILDIDVIVIVDEPSEETERRVENAVNELGYRQSDTNLGAAIEHTESVLNDLDAGNEPSEKLPIDVHLWSRKRFQECLEAVANGERRVVMQGRALHAGWEDHAVDFWFDFVFSFTELSSFDAELATQIVETRKAVKERFSFTEIVGILRESSPRAERLLCSPDILRVLKERIDSW